MILIIKQVHLLVILKSLSIEMLVLKIPYLDNNVYNQNFYSNFHLVSIDNNNRALELNKHNSYIYYLHRYVQGIIFIF